MNKSLIQKLFTSGQVANQRLSEMSAAQKSQVEETWDIEHAYYSSALEGSKLDKSEFEKIARETK